MLTKQQALERTKTMWFWIARECLRQKKRIDKFDWFVQHGKEQLYPQTFCGCWCCKYNNEQMRRHHPDKKQQDRNTNGCAYCPIREWNQNRHITCVDGSVGFYGLWMDDIRTDETDRTAGARPEDPEYLVYAKYARQIALLAVKNLNCLNPGKE